MRTSFVALILIQLFSYLAIAEVSITGEGAIKVGTATDSCNATTKGAFRWSDTNTCMEVCNESLWQCVSVAVCADTLPDTISFNTLVNQTTSTLVTSNIVQVTGIPGCQVEVTVAGQGSPQYRTCSNSSCSTIVQDWTSSKGNIVENNYIQMRLTTAAAGGIQYIGNLVVGSRNANFSATTDGDCTDPNPPVGTICADGTVYIGLTPDGNVKMYATRCRGGKTWDGSNCTGSSLSMKWSEDNTIFTGNNNAITGEANTIALAALSNADAPYNAAAYCNTLNIHGHTDWYLPARTEATLMINACGVLDDTSCTSTWLYWDSTENSFNNARFWRFNGQNGSYNKSNSASMWCVRK